MWVLVVSGLVRVGRWGQALWFGGVEPVGQALWCEGAGARPCGLGDWSQRARSCWNGDLSQWAKAVSRRVRGGPRGGPKRWASWSVSPHGQSDLYLVWFFVCPLCCGVSVGWYERQCGSMWFRGLSVPAPVWDLVVSGLVRV